MAKSRLDRAMPQFIRIAAITAGIATLAACATPAPPPPPPPPPPQAKVIPPRPLPPGNATPSMTIPLVGVDGVRQTVNAGLSSNQTIWNLRSALNVAALNCLDAQHSALVPNYKAYLDTHKRKLSATNTALGKEFQSKHGRGYRDMQDTYMTQVYNYFALPPAQDGFCNVAHAISGEIVAVPSAELETFSAGALGRIEAEFENFFRAYEQYRIDLAAWDAQYGSAPVNANATYGPATTQVTTVPASSAAPDAELPTEGPIFRPSPTVQGGNDGDGEGS